MHQGAHLHSNHLLHQTSQSLLNLMARNSFCCWHFHIILISHEKSSCGAAKFAQVTMFEVVERDLNVLGQQCDFCTLQKGFHQQIQLNVWPFSVAVFRSRFHVAPNIIFIMQMLCRNGFCFNDRAQLCWWPLEWYFVSVFSRHFSILCCKPEFVKYSTRLRQHPCICQISVSGRVERAPLSQQHHKKNRVADQQCHSWTVSQKKRAISTQTPPSLMMTDE